MAYFNFESKEYKLDDELSVMLTDIGKTVNAQGGVYVFDSNDNQCGDGDEAKIENGYFWHYTWPASFYKLQPGGTYYIYINLNLPDEGDWWWPGYPNNSGYKYGGPNKKAIKNVNSFTIATIPRKYKLYNLETKSFISDGWLTNTTGGMSTGIAGSNYTFLGGYCSDSQQDVVDKVNNGNTYDIDSSTRYIDFNNDYNEDTIYFILVYKSAPGRYYRMYDIVNKIYFGQGGEDGRFTKESYIIYQKEKYEFVGWDYNSDDWPGLDSEGNPAWSEMPGGYMDEENHYLYFLEDDTIKYYNLYYSKNPTFTYKCLSVSGVHSLLNISGSTENTELTAPTKQGYSYLDYERYPTEDDGPSSFEEYQNISCDPREDPDTIIQFSEDYLYYLLLYMKNWTKSNSTSINLTNYINKSLDKSLTLATNCLYPITITVPKQTGKIFISTEECFFINPIDKETEVGCIPNYASIYSLNKISVHNILGMENDDNVNQIDWPELFINIDGQTATYYIVIYPDANLPSTTLKYSIGFSTPFTMTYYLNNGENLPEPTEIYYNIPCQISPIIPTWKNHYFIEWIDNKTGHSYKPKEEIRIEDTEDHSCLGHFGFTIKYNINTGNESIDPEIMTDVDNFIIEDRVLTKSSQEKFKTFTVVKKTDEDLIFNEYKGGTKKAILSYDFYKWNSQSNGSGNYYDTNYNYIITELDSEASGGILDLYATWNEHESDYVIDKKITVEIKQNEQIKEGYKFLGYSKIKGNNIPQYLPSNSYQFLTQTILYPVFEKEKKGEFIKVNGQWEQIDKKLIKVNNKWYDIEKIKLKTEGGWKEWLKP